MKLKQILKFLVSFSSLFLLIGNTYAFNLVGTWKLISIEDKSNVFPCYSPTGHLLYTPTGYMAAGVNCMKSDKSMEPSFEIKDMTFYIGKYDVKGNKVIHIVENTSSPNFYGKKLEREIKVINEKRMILTAELKKGQFLHLTWEKIA